MPTARRYSISQGRLRKEKYDQHGLARNANENMTPIQRLGAPLDHVEGWPPHCRAHHHYHMFGKLFEEVDKCKLCSLFAWKTSKNCSIFENDPYDYEEQKEAKSDTDDDSDTHEISPVEEDLVTSVTNGVKTINKRTKRSQEAMGDIKDMTMEILNKISKVEEAVENIQEGTFRTREMVGRVDQRIEENHNIVSKFLAINTELVEGIKEFSEGQNDEK